MAYKLVTLGGDGTGPEVMREGLRVLHAVSEPLGVAWSIEDIPCGGRFYLEHGSRDWPEGSEQTCDAADLILLGAVGWPDPKGTGPVTMANGKMAGYSPVIGNRTRLNLYANVRPVKLYQGVQHRIHGAHKQVWEPGRVDMVFLRENTEDLYAGMGGKLSPGGRTEVATDVRVITRRASEQIIRHAFELCRRRNKGAPKDGKLRVTAIVKDNVMQGCQFFRDVFFEIGEQYPEIEKETAIVDAFTQWLIGQPEHYDVCVTTNMFGDILTDLASVLQGGMGMAVGANVGHEHAMFEPIHGSAPKHAGLDKVNPIAMILSVKEGCEWLGARKKDARLVKMAEAIEAAVIETLATGAPLTYDVVGPEKAAKCSEVGEAIAKRAAARVR
jgi:isocitrate/isopropylmalate dehydrogenase